MTTASRRLRAAAAGRSPIDRVKMAGDALASIDQSVIDEFLDRELYDNDPDMYVGFSVMHRVCQQGDLTDVWRHSADAAVQLVCDILDLAAVDEAMLLIPPSVARESGWVWGAVARNMKTAVAPRPAVLAQEAKFVASERQGRPYPHRMKTAVSGYAQAVEDAVAKSIDDQMAELQKLQPHDSSMTDSHYETIDGVQRLVVGDDPRAGIPLGRHWE